MSSAASKSPTALFATPIKLSPDTQIDEEITQIMTYARLPIELYPVEVIPTSKLNKENRKPNHRPSSTHTNASAPTLKRKTDSEKADQPPKKVKLDQTEANLSSENCRVKHKESASSKPSGPAASEFSKLSCRDIVNPSLTAPVLVMPDHQRRSTLTKVFSGNVIERAVSSSESIIRDLEQRVRVLGCTGGASFDTLKPVLRKLKPEELRKLEDRNPYLLKDSESLWQTHVLRKFRSCNRQENESWRDMFDRRIKEDENKLKVLAENIRKRQEESANSVSKVKLAFVASAVKPPRGVFRKQELQGKDRNQVINTSSIVGVKKVATNIVATGNTRLDKKVVKTKNAVANARSKGKPEMKPLFAKCLSQFKGW